MRVNVGSIVRALVVGLALLALYVGCIVALGVGAWQSVGLVLYPILAPLVAVTFLKIEPAETVTPVDDEQELIALFGDDQEGE